VTPLPIGAMSRHGGGSAKRRLESIGRGFIVAARRFWVLAAALSKSGETRDGDGLSSCCKSTRAAVVDGSCQWFEDEAPTRQLGGRVTTPTASPGMTVSGTVPERCNSQPAEPSSAISMALTNSTSRNGLAGPPPRPAYTLEPLAGLH
jgi:hypothetical protein